MKKLIFTLAITLGVFVSSSAQEAGQFWVGGSVGITSTSVKDGDDYTNFKILPEFGYVINDKIGVGINVGYSQTEATFLEGLPVATGKIESFVVAPFVRYSALKGNIGGIFIDGGIGYGHGKNKDEDIKVDMFEVGFRPGVALSVSDKVSLTAKFGFLGYQYTKAKDEDSGADAKVNTFGLDLDLSQCLFGVNFVF